MHEPKSNWPRQDSGAMGSHLKCVPQYDRPPVCTDNLVTVKPIEALRASEAKLDGLSGHVLLDKVPDWAMPASRANAEGTIKFHSRPRVPWPQGIFSRSERINERPDLPGGGLQLTFVNVEYSHKPPIGDAQRLVNRLAKAERSGALASRC